MYVDWYGVNFVVFSVVEICVDYSSVYMFHVLIYVLWFVLIYAV